MFLIVSWLMVANVWGVATMELESAALHRAQLYAAAESYIESQPRESTVSVAKIFSDYQHLQERWVGTDNAGFNQIQIGVNPLFAKTKLFNTPSAAESAAQLKFYRLKYTTTSPDGVQDVSGLLIIPPTTTPKGVILFFHSTIAGKLNVPSLHFNDYKSVMLAAIFAANGYVVVAPDYIGLGDNFKAVHPYILYPQINIEDGKNMLLAALPFMYQQSLIRKPALSYKLFVSGYSEGASYALWFSRAYQESSGFAGQLKCAKLRLTKTVPIEGAYDLTGVMFPFLLTNQVNDTKNKYNINTSFWGSLLKPELLSNVMVSYSYYNHHPINQLLNSEFYNLQCTLLPNSSCGQDDMGRFNLENLTLGNYKTFPLVLKYFYAALFKTNQELVYNPLFNSVQPLLYKNAASDPQLLATAAKADIVNWKTTNPITLVSLRQDSLVPEQNSADAFRGMRDAGSLNLKYLQVDNQILRARALFGPAVSDHVSFELYALLIALNEFNLAVE